VILTEKWKGQKRIEGVIPIQQRMVVEIFYEDPKDLALQTLVVICHPNPLAQGSMHHKIPTLVARCAHSSGLPTLRFQFSGVGLTSGPYIDFTQQVTLLDQIIIKANEEGFDRIILAGFSFGAACILQSAHPFPKLAIAPAWKFIEIPTLSPSPKITIIHAQDDPIAFASESFENFRKLESPDKALTILGQGEHFFQGQLEMLKKHCLFFFNDKASGAG